MNIPLSVIIPFYNVEEFIPKCLESIENQTLENIEIIFINDGSEDKSSEHVKKFIQNTKHRTLYIEQNNGGLSNARNTGLKNCSGKYVAFLDSDDFINPIMYEELYKNAIENNFDLVSCNFYWKYDNKIVVEKIQKNSSKKELLINNSPAVVWNKIYKKEVLINNGINFLEGYIQEDIDFNFRLYPFLKNFNHIDKALIYYVQRENSIISKKEIKMDIYQILENVINFYKKKNIYDEYKYELEHIITRILFCSTFLRIMKIQNNEKKNHYLIKNWNFIQQHFPLWKKNTYLKRKSLKNVYMLSINNLTYKIYSKLFNLFLK